MSKPALAPSNTNNAKSLVLVVGAGASHEVKMPLGSDLKQSIAKLLDIRYDYRQVGGDDVIANAFSQICRNQNNEINLYLNAAWRIRDAMPQAISIDNFIDAHRGDNRIAICGKLAIARSILLAEASCSLKIDRQRNQQALNYKSLEKTWFNSFFQLLTENCDASELKERLSRIAIVCFNYDRCIEQYLHQAFQNYYGMNPSMASEVLEELEIFHPYGTVGQLPLQTKKRVPIEFGATPTAAHLVAILDEIRTFTEGSDESRTDISRIREILSDCERLAFIGFAFHRLNVELLFPTPPNALPTRGTSVLSTGIGISDPDAAVIREELFALAGFNPNLVTIAKVHCADFFSEYRRSLSFR